MNGFILLIAAVVGVSAQYWVIRLAVYGGIKDADQRKRTWSWNR